MQGFKYYNPVGIHFGPDSLDVLPQLAEGKNLLVTSPGAVRRGMVQGLKGRVEIVAVIDDVQPNPTFEYLRTKFEFVQGLDYGKIIALGGGSVLDTAKVLSVQPADGQFASLEGLIKGAKADYTVNPLLAIPTTAGTGSEVTPWATVWDMGAGEKYSLHLPDLWPQACVCQPSLTKSMPWDLTLHTGLDALSHSLEAIWNKNANLISTGYVITAAKKIVRTLPRLREDLSNLELRTDMMYAALQAGLAFSNTKTALAHAISYYLTAHKGIPHGLAAGFPLPHIIKAAQEKADVHGVLQYIWGPNPYEACLEFFIALGVPTSCGEMGISPQDLEEMRGSLNAARAGNSVVDVARVFDILAG